MAANLENVQECHIMTVHMAANLEHVQQCHIMTAQVSSGEYFAMSYFNIFAGCCKVLCRGEDGLRLDYLGCCVLSHFNVLCRGGGWPEVRLLGLLCTVTLQCSM